MVEFQKANPNLYFQDMLIKHLLHLEGGTDIIKLFLEANANPDYFEKLDYFVHDYECNWLVEIWFYFVHLS